MKKLDGLSLLTIAICCCIFVSLGYVKLFHGVAQKVSKPNTAEFWQVRSLALNLRNPAKEARLAFNNGDLHTFDTATLTDTSDHAVADLTISSDSGAGKAMASQAGLGFGSFFKKTNEADDLRASHDSYIDDSSQFAMEYNRELTRLINSNR